MPPFLATFLVFSSSPWLRLPARSSIGELAPSGRLAAGAMSPWWARVLRGERAQWGSLGSLGLEGLTIPSPGKGAQERPRHQASVLAPREGKGPGKREANANL